MDAVQSHGLLSVTLVRVQDTDSTCKCVIIFDFYLYCPYLLCVFDLQSLPNRLAQLPNSAW